MLGKASMKNRTVIVALAFLLCLPAFARVGETLDDCKARYGEVVKTDWDGGEVHFRKGDFSVVIGFLTMKGKPVAKAQSVIYSNGSEADAKEMSDIEIMTLLEANGGKKKWVPITRGSAEFPAKACKGWTTEDKTLSAWYFEENRNLVVFTGALMKDLLAQSSHTE